MARDYAPAVDPETHKKLLETLEWLGEMRDAGEMPPAMYIDAVTNALAEAGYDRPTLPPGVTVEEWLTRHF